MSEKLKYKRLSKEKNWKIKKKTRGDGKITFTPYYRTFLGAWLPHTYTTGEFTFESTYSYTFDTIDDASNHILNEIQDNKTFYQHEIDKINASKVVKTQSIPFKSTQKRREDNINTILDD